MSAPVTGRAAPRVLLGVAGGIAAYKACELLRRLTETGHDVRVVPTGVGAAVRRRRHVRGAVRAAGAHRRVRRRPGGPARQARPGGRPRGGRAGDGGPAGPRRARPRRRPAHRRAAHRPLPGAARPAMHTEMWEHPATRDNVALLRVRGSVVMEPASGRLTGRDTGPGPAARARPRSPSWPGCCWSGPTRCPATSPAGGWWSPRAAPARRSTPSASSATARRAGRVTRSPGSRLSAARR